MGPHHHERDDALTLEQAGSGSVVPYSWKRHIRTQQRRTSVVSPVADCSLQTQNVTGENASLPATRLGLLAAEQPMARSCACTRRWDDTNQRQV